MSRTMSYKTLLVIIAVLSIMLLPVSAMAATVDDIAKEFICQCGCNMVLLNCSHAECAPRETMLASIKQKVDQGQTQEQIIQSFVLQYGEQVLASPPKKGFNLTAWITPFVAILAGAAVIGVALRRWVKKGRRSEVSVQDTLDPSEDRYLRRVEKELQEFSERSFR